MKFQTSSWRFQSPGAIPDGVVSEFFDLIITMATQGPFQEIIEDFKSNFASGKSTMWSSNSDWAQSDLHRYMSLAAENAPRFIAAFVDGCNALAKEGKDVPDTDVINSILAKHESGYQVAGDTIVSGKEQLPTAKKAEQSRNEKFSKPVRYSAEQSDLKKAKDAPALRAFLCHSSGDKDAVRKLYKALSADGFVPWLDEEDLIAGQDWDAEIKKAVRKSHVVIVCLSATSTTKAGYVQKEIKVALDVADEQPEGTIFIIPLRIENCGVPDRLKKWHWVDLFTANGYEKLVTALKARAATLK